MSKRPDLSARNRKHGQAAAAVRTAEYRAWANMLQRCYNPKNRFFKDYGQRGIRVCERWRESFEAFFSDMGTKPSPRHSLDRIDNDGGYSKTNCRWATAAEQRRNCRRMHMLTIDGKTQCLEDWAAEAGISRKRIDNRLRLGWSPKDAVFAPLNVNPKGRGGITIAGITKSASEWAKEPGAASARLIIKRINQGWVGIDAVFTPSRKKVRNGN